VKLKIQLTSQVRSGIGAAVLSVLIGLLLRTFPLGQGLVRLSYDLPFAFGAPKVPDEVVIVTMDEISYLELRQTYGKPWDRTLHAQLLRKLTADQCRLIVLDVLFADAGPAEADEALANAIQAHGKVVIGAEPVDIVKQGIREGEAIRPPEQRFRNAVNKNWGVAAADPDVDGTVRRHYPGTALVPSLAWLAAELAGAAVTRSPSNRLTERWLRYYGPFESIPRVPYHEALKEPPGYFRDKTVFIGGQPKTVFPGDEPDEFRTPYTRWSGGSTSGVDIQATMFLNLLRGDWLNQLAPWKECLALLFAGGVFGFGGAFLRPGLTVFLGFVGSVGSFLLGAWLVWQHNTWFAWMIIAGAQIPVAVGTSVLSYTKLLSREKEAAQKALRESKTLPMTVTLVPQSAAVGGPQPSVSIPDHELVGRIGGGSYGDVYLARNAVGLYHAVKIVFRQRFETEVPFKREYNGIEKFMPVSRLHPNLVQLFHVGRNDPAGFFFYIMEVADDMKGGQRIDPATYSAKDLGKELVQRSRLPIRECLHLVVPLADALACLHSHGLVHRDIKPSNIIYVRGVPKLADIGLVTTASSTQTHASYVGTEGFIPPEGPGSPAADVFSLGKVLYEAAMGFPPKQWPDLRTSVLGGPEGAEAIELNRVLLKALAEEPKRRYRDGSEFCEALRSLQQQLAALGRR
jgi:CHASE2 domain-containing sensor protein